MYLFVEKGIRRGISSIAKRYSKTNNKYMESCDISKLSRYITFWMQIICMVGYGINHYQKEIDELD